MADRVISSTGSYTGYDAAVSIDASTDYMLIQQSGAYKKINRTVLLGLAGSPVGTSDSQVLTNKTIGNTNTINVKGTLLRLQDATDTTKQAGFVMSSITTATTRSITIPDLSGTMALTDQAQTLTNKTIAGGSNTISGISESMQTLADNSTNDVSITKHGYTPKAPNDTTKFLRGDATWAVPTLALGYSITGYGLIAGPADSTTYYFGGLALSNFTMDTTAATKRLYIPKAGTLKVVEGFIYTTVGGASNETSTISFRLNNTTDTSISALLDLSAQAVTFSNTSLSVSVARGDYFEFKWATPAWATNPSGTTMFTVIAYIE